MRFNFRREVKKLHGRLYTWKQLEKAFDAIVVRNLRVLSVETKPRDLLQRAVRKGWIIEFENSRKVSVLIP